jgi:endonuclease III-like uncharacterized protein
MSKNEEYSSPMKQAAISMHELYTTLKDAGFSRKDAIELLAKIMAGTINEALNNQKNDSDD